MTEPAQEDDRPAVLLVRGPGDRAGVWSPLAQLIDPLMRTIEASAATADDLRSLLGGDDRRAIAAFGDAGPAAQRVAVEDGVEALVLIGSPRDDGADLATLDGTPVFLLWGEDDDVVPWQVGAAMMDTVPMSSMAVLPECGHDLTAEAPETIFPFINEFLRSNYLGLTHAHDDGHEHGHGHAGGGPVMVEVLTSRPEPEPPR